MNSKQLINEISEDELLKQIFPLLPSNDSVLLGPGDDCAVVAAPDGKFVVSTDVLVEGSHFIREWSTGYDVGWRAVMQNLADVAAMGGNPVSIVVSLVLPRSLRVAWVLDLAKGIADAAAKHEVAVVGGDLAAGPFIAVSVTVHGDLAGRVPVTRAGAKVGDRVYHAGRAGFAAAGLELLANTESNTEIPTEFQPLLDGYRRPDPPVELGVVAAKLGATAMIDISDGLLTDANRIAVASGVVLDLHDPFIVFSEDARALAGAASLLGRSVVKWLLSGGEDHGLLVTFSPEVDVPAEFKLIGAVRRIGISSETGSTKQVLVAGDSASESLTGWDHFRS